jgi:hypothetical protein
LECCENSILTRREKVLIIISDSHSLNRKTMCLNFE